MADLSDAEGKAGDANGVISEFRSPQSESHTVIADLPRTATKEVTGHADGNEDIVGLLVKNTKLFDAGQGSKRIAVLSPVSPPSSDSRASLRTENLKDGPLKRHELNKSPLSSRSVVANVPAPVFTRPINRSYEKFELPKQPRLTYTPSLEENMSYIGSSRMEESTSVDKSCRAGVSIASFESHSTPSEQYGRSDTDQIATFQTVEDIMSVNPYLRRADEIGFRHQVPGVGHLGSSLVPRGWKEGDPPITPAEAKKLFDIDRQSAVHDLELSLANQKHLNDEEKEKVSVSIDDQWKARLLLDRTVLTERLLIHRQHHERQQRNIERLRGDEQCFSQNRLSQVPQPMQPRAMASYMAAPPPESPCWRRISNYPNQLDGRFDDPRTPQNVGSLQSQMGPGQSPMTLDRNHMSTRMGSSYIPYQPNNAEIARQALANQQCFNTYGSVYKPCGAQEQLSQRTLSSSIGVRPTVHFEGNNVWTPHHGCLPEEGSISQYRHDPFTYSSYPHVGSFGVEYPPVRSASFEEHPLPRPVPYQPTQSGYEGSTNNNIYHSGYDPSRHGRPYEENPQYKTSQTESSPTRDRSVRGENLPKNSQNEINKTGYPTDSDPNVPKLDRLSGQEPSNQIQNGQQENATALRRESHSAQHSNHKATDAKPTLDLPATIKEPAELNERVAETSVNHTGQWYDNEIELEKLPTLIPSKEFVRAALEEAERGRGGAKTTPRKRRPKPEIDATRGFSIPDAAAKLLALNGLPDHRDDSHSDPMPSRHTAFPSVAPATRGRSSAYTPSPPKKEEVAPASENGSDNVEDPNDGDYGKRTTHRRTITPRKNPACRSNAALKKKRKSAVSVTPVKRTRLSMDGPAYYSEEDAEGSDDPAKEDLT